jgi:hypothetical protein
MLKIYKTVTLPDISYACVWNVVPTIKGYYIFWCKVLNSVGAVGKSIHLCHLLLYTGP